MSWLFETLIDRIWDEYVYRTNKRSGWKGAVFAITAPLLGLSPADGGNPVTSLNDGNFVVTGWLQ